METLEKIDQLLKCAICLHRYDNPKITSCFHTFCDTCINKQFNTKNTFICPVCSVETNQSSAFIENSLINTIVNILTEKDGGRRNCDLCDEEASDPAVGRCNDCAKFLCEHHVLNHKKTKDTKTHVVTPLATVPIVATAAPTQTITITNPRESRTSRGQRHVKRELVEEPDDDDDRDEPPPERPPIKEGPSYSEMIIQALRSLGGRGTSAQIAEYISEHYAEVLKYKTKTWRNSVMGCLSVKSHLFSKEPMEGRPDKYIWVLREGVTNGNSNAGARQKRPQKKPRVKQITASKSEEPAEMVEEDEQALAGLMALDFGSTSKTASAATTTTTSVTASPTTTVSSPEPSNLLDADADKERVDVDLITEVLNGLGGSGTTDQITEAIVTNYKETFPNYSRRKLSYTINAILSAPKYRDRFLKDKIEGHTNSIWKLAKADSSPENAETSEKTEVTSS